MSREEFERVVAKALDGLPSEVAGFLENVAVVVEDEPTDEDLVRPGSTPRPTRCSASTRDLPCPSAGEATATSCPTASSSTAGRSSRSAATANELVREIQDTVVHEIGHYFGLGEEDLP